MDLRKAKKLGKGVKKKCEWCGDDYIAFRSTARVCQDCRIYLKKNKDLERNKKMKDKRLKKKIPKELKDKRLYDEFIDDIAEAVAEKLLPYFTIK